MRQGEITTDDRNLFDRDAAGDRFGVPIPDEDIENVPYYHPGEDSEEVKYLLERRKALGGFIPQRRRQDGAVEAPALENSKVKATATLSGIKKHRLVFMMIFLCESTDLPTF